MDDRTLHRTIPSRPMNGGMLVRTPDIPLWMPSMVGAVLHGRIRPGNGISLSPTGNLLLYRRISENDVLLFPELRGVGELWMEFALDLTSVS